MLLDDLCPVCVIINVRFKVKTSLKSSKVKSTQNYWIVNLFLVLVVNGHVTVKIASASVKVKKFYAN